MTDEHSSRDSSNNRQNDTQRTVGPIHENAQKPTAPRNDREAKPRSHINWNALNAVTDLVFTGIIAVATVINVCIATRQWSAMNESNGINQRTLVAANRAWLTPTSFDILTPPEAADGPNFMVHYQNAGRFPALDTKNSMGWSPMVLTKPIAGPRDYPESPMWGAVENTIKTVCNSSEPLNGGQAVFPSTSNEQNMISGRPEGPIDKAEIIAGRQLVIITGCLTYRTFNEIHHTGFCRYVTKARTQQWEILSCQVGNFAN